MSRGGAAAPAAPRRQQDRPPGCPAQYEPAQYEHRAVLADGRAVLLRPVVPGDVGQLADAVRHAGPDTSRRRFPGAAGPCTAEQLRHLLEPDDVHRFAVAAFDPSGPGVGIARYAGERTWPAVEQGAHSALVDVFADDAPVARLPADCGLPERSRTEYGVVEDEVQPVGPALSVTQPTRATGRPRR